MASSAETPLAPVPDPGDDGLALRFYDVTSADGTRLRAWTNDVDGPTVLLCNGLGTNPYAWPALLDPDCGVHVISWNHRGVSGSARPADPDAVGIDVLVEDALAVMDDAGVEACPVMGWSMGVNTMFELATLHPSRVTGLFAVGGVPGGTFSSVLAPLHVPRFARTVLAVNIARVLRVAGRPLSLIGSHLPMGPLSGKVISHSGFMFPVADEEITRRAVKEFLTTPTDWYMHLALAASKHVRVSLTGIDVPTAFVAGTYDILASAADMEAAAASIPGATYVELKATHFLTLEHPAEVHELLLDLLDRVDRA